MSPPLNIASLGTVAGPNGDKDDNSLDLNELNSEEEEEDDGDDGDDGENGVQDGPDYLIASDGDPSSTGNEEDADVDTAGDQAEDGAEEEDIVAEQQQGSSNGAAESYRPYGDAPVRSCLTGVVVRKRSRLMDVVGPRRRRSTTQESQTSEVTQQETRKDAVAYAVRLAASLLESTDATIRDGNQEMEEYMLSDELEPGDFELRAPSWARRPPHGKQYGVTYIEIYREAIKSLFMAGVNDSSKKMNPAMMRQELIKLNLGRYTVPGENEIRAEVSKLVAQQKAEQRAGTSARARPSNKIPEQYSIALVEEFNRAFALGQSQCSGDLDQTLACAIMKPKAVVAKLKERFRQGGALPRDFPDDKKLASKISALKTGERRKAETKGSITEQLR